MNTNLSVPVIKALARSVLPAGLLRLIENRFFRNRWVGEYASWEEAEQRSAGYSDARILERVVAATRTVREGASAFEQDGVVFERTEANPYILAGLYRSLSAAGSLRVLDVGGSLGSAYWRHRGYLRDLCELRWAVVEQAAFVQAGRREFSNEELSFHSTVGGALDGGVPDYALLSAVLGYVKDPYALLDEIKRAGPRFIHLDRTVFVVNAPTRIAVQCLPRNLGGYSYPCRLFDKNELLRCFDPQYAVVWEYTTESTAHRDVELGGILLKKVSA